MSFTTGGIFHRESVKIATLYLELRDWDAVRDKVLSDNLLQARTRETSKRLCREIISRLNKLSSHELNLLVHATSQEQGYLLWIAVCRRYKFIADCYAASCTTCSEGRARDLQEN
ncbi:MAG: BrxA family protein [Nitrospirota bacterium]